MGRRELPVLIAILGMEELSDEDSGPTPRSVRRAKAPEDLRQRQTTSE
jgi:F0F1-type ATP synthase beta subunit